MLVSQLITRFTHPRVRGTLNQNVVGLTHNSRAAGPGIVFVALPEGQRTNPYQSIAAVERGAVAVICPPGVPLPERGTCITVSDPTEALALAAAELFERPAENLDVIGVRGPRAANVAILLQQLLGACDWRCGLLTSRGCEIGDRLLPIPLAHMEAVAIQEALRHLVGAECKACVLELSPHTDLARNLCGVKIAASLDIESEAEGRSVGLGELSAGTFRATDVVLSSSSIHFNVPVGRNRVVVRAPLAGRSIARDLLFALRGALHLGLGPQALTRACSRLKPIPGSLAPVRCGQPFAVFVDEANSPEHLSDVLKDASEITRDRLLVVLGGSADHTVAERESLGRVGARWADEVIVTSDNPRELDAVSLARDLLQGVRQSPGAVSHVELDRYRAIRRALRIAGPGDTVLIAGKGHRTVQQLERCVIPFDDAVVASESLAESRYIGSDL